MNKQNKRTLPSGTLRHAQGSVLSLHPLKMVLAAAERKSPERPPRPLQDPNEQLALQLIEKSKHPHSISLADLKIEPPQPIFPTIQEMAGSDAR